MSPKAVSLVAASMLLIPSPVHAQYDDRPGFFAPFMSLFTPQRRYEPAPAIHRMPHSFPEITVRPRRERESIIEDETPEEDMSDRALGSRAFCVRTCDGFFFPVGRSASGGTAQAQTAMCAQMCPASEVALYSLPQGGDVSDAVGPRGRRYSQLPNAYRFRSELSPSCTCNGRMGGGLANVTPANDFTLRRGDIVAGSEGPLVFSGGGRLPFQSSQFVPARPRELSREMMQRFVRVRANATAETPLTRVDETEITIEATRPRTAVRVVPLSMAASASPTDNPRRAIRGKVHH